ncbi:MAG: zinc ribbon domain-containing protein [Actinomycetota bacterium]
MVQTLANGRPIRHRYLLPGYGNRLVRSPFVTRSCPKCHSLILAEASSCQYCGHQLQADAPKSEKPPPAAVPAPDPETKTCPACAEEIKFAARVCRYCGYNFDSTVRTAPPPQGNQAPPTQPLKNTLKSTDAAWVKNANMAIAGIVLLVLVIVVIVATRASAPEQPKQLSEGCLIWQEDVLYYWEVREPGGNVSFDDVVRIKEDTRPPGCPEPSP